jgi:hypothetical protein
MPYATFIRAKRRGKKKDITFLPLAKWIDHD